MAKIQNKEILKKELDKRIRQKEKKPFSGYMVFLAAMVALVHLLDEYASSVSGAIQSSVVNELFVEKMGISYAQGLSMLSIVSLLALLGSILASFFKALSDKYGRKPFLFISSLGMALGMLLCAVSETSLMYFIGRAVMGFFTATDFQVLYITEVAPDSKRSTFYSATKAIGTFGIILIAVARSFYTADGNVQWRLVYLIPAILGVVLAAVILFCSRETDVFLEHRIEKLQNEINGIEEEQPKKEKGSFGMAFKLVFKDRQLRMMTVSTLLFMASMMAFTGYYESVMTLGGMDADQVTNALFVYPIAWALLLFISGFVSDRFGRKTSVIVFGIIAVICQIGFVSSAGSGVAPIIVGLLLGGAIGGYWTCNNSVGMMASEIAPTELRASVSSVMGILALISTLISTAVYAIIVAKVSLNSLCIFGSLITMTVAIVFTVLSTTETAGRKLD